MVNYGAEAQDLSSMWNKRLREMARAAEIWACPYCIERRIFHDERLLFQHAESEHKEKFEDASAQGEQAVEELRVNISNDGRTKGGTGVAAFRSRPQPRSAQATGPRRRLSAEPPSGTPTANHPSTGPTPDLNDLQKLSLQSTQDAQITRLGSRKRGPDQDADPAQDPSRQSTTPEDDGNSTPPPRSRAKSGPSPQFMRSGGKAGSRRGVATSQRLFDPKTDSLHPTIPEPTSPGLGLTGNAEASLQFDRSPAGESSRPLFSRKTFAPTQPAESLPRTERQLMEGEAADRAAPGAQVPGATSQMILAASGPGRSGLVSSRHVPHTKLLLQPETRPITHEKLVTEVKTIYRGLVMVEAKCVDVVSKQVAANKGKVRPPTLNDEQWRALVALHRNLLYDHHDFFLASQHPAASLALSKLATKYAMPARMWRHGIHSFLELLRHRLPESLEHMLAFIYLAYSMVALLYETVPTFKDTWIECLGDLARYRMAIEDEDLRDRETWTGVARFWYSKAADKDPSVGRLDHHLAILARPDTLRQLYYYSRSLTCSQPFLSARESALTLFDPVLKGPVPGSAQHRSPLAEEYFVKAHGILFTLYQIETIEDIINHYLLALDKALDRVTGRWKEQGVFIAVANAAALFEYGSTKADLKLAFDQRRMDEEIRREDAPAIKSVGEPDFRSSVQLAVHSAEVATAVSGALPGARPTGPAVSAQDDDMDIDLGSNEGPNIRPSAVRLTFATLDLALQRAGDANIMPNIHVTLVLIWSMASVPGAMDPFETDVPWNRLVTYLNIIGRAERYDDRLLGPDFPPPKEAKERIRPLREDYCIAGQIWSERYFPEYWFEQAAVDDEERELELASMAEPRLERVLWLGVRIASFDRCIHFDKASTRFSVDPEYVVAESSPLSKPHVGDDGLTLPPNTTFGDIASGSDDDPYLHTESDPGETADNDTSDAEPARLDSSRASAQIMTPSASAPTEDIKEVYRSDEHPPPAPSSSGLAPDQDVA